MKKLKLTNHEFFLLCDDFESSSFDTCISLIHSENVTFVKDLINSLTICTDIDDYENDFISFSFNLSDIQIIKLKDWVEWSYKESFSYYLHEEDKEVFLNLREKIIKI